ncbi:MAG: SymE family type I addiction module toxin [Chryseotalea sp.]
MPVKSVEIRKIKVYRKFQKRANKFIEVPEIRLTGKWLNQNGFITGKFVKVTISKNRIVLSTDKKIIVT